MFSLKKVYHAFINCDTMKIDLQALYSISKTLNTLDTMQKKQIRIILEHFKVERTEGLSFDEFVLAWSFIAANYRAAFELCDANFDGVITKHSLTHFLSSLGQSESNYMTRVEQLFVECLEDENNPESDLLPLSRFKVFWRKYVIDHPIQGILRSMSYDDRIKHQCTRGTLKNLIQTLDFEAEKIKLPELEEGFISVYDMANFVYIALCNSTRMMVKITKTEANRMAECMVIRRCRKGETIIRQGEPGNEFFVIRRGKVEVHIRKIKGMFGWQQPKKAVQRGIFLGSGKFFGEIALLEECNRTASVIAVQTTDLWVLKKSDFVRILVKKTNAAKENRARAEFLRSISPVYRNMSVENLCNWAINTQKKSFSNGQFIIREGGSPDLLYILVEGLLLRTVTSPSGEYLEVNELERGSIFGHVAIAFNEKHSMGVYAVEDSKLLVVGLDAVKMLAPTIWPMILRTVDEDKESRAYALSRGIVAKMMSRRIAVQIKRRRSSLTLRAIAHMAILSKGGAKNLLNAPQNILKSPKNLETLSNVAKMKTFMPSRKSPKNKQMKKNTQSFFPTISNTTDRHIKSENRSAKSVSSEKRSNATRFSITPKTGNNSKE